MARKYERLSKAARRRRREIVLQRDGFHCAYCETDFAHDPMRLVVEHIVPLIRGGTDDLTNVVIACWGCNQSKGAKPVEEWLLRFIGEAA
jgi:5-methylcytosine-specific restriction endonuclease McrA